MRLIEYFMKLINLAIISYADALKWQATSRGKEIWDPVRKRSFLVTPEEIVRQTFIQWLQVNHPIHFNRTSVERSLQINLRTKRFDLLVYDKYANPWMLVEFKAPGVRISQSVLDQISWYNYALKAPFLLVTNGIDSYVAQIDFLEQSYNFITEFPS